jgi:hypothetical protein
MTDSHIAPGHWSQPMRARPETGPAGYRLKAAGFRFRTMSPAGLGGPQCRFHRAAGNLVELLGPKITKIMLLGWMI